MAGWSIVEKPKTIRCPYCVERGDFKPMAAESSGEWYVCVECGHLARPDSSAFRCVCSKCVTLELSLRKSA